ncbi:MAG: nucleotidyltransferase [Pseudomonadota bacterium]|nr:nucleotidyltransferase [Pseudomonadota bacterium]
MSVNAHLAAIASQCCLRDDERETVKTSVRHIQNALQTYFGSDVSHSIVFGSFSRKTILPRMADPLSDVDLLVCFKDGRHAPQTYMDQLRRFVEKRYQRSEIRQSNPTIQLSMGHIRIELVPAVESFFSPYVIPAKAKDYQEWIGTDPNGFDEEIISANQNNRSLVKPLSRILKRWNVSANRPFESFDLERQIVEHAPSGFFTYQNHADAFYRCVPNLDLGWSAAQWKRNALARLKRMAAEARSAERLRYGETARQQVARLIPLATAGAG